MSRRSKVSSVASSRIHNSYIHRATVVNRSEEVEAVDPVKGVKNKTSSATANYLTSSDAFYDQMEALREEYKNFYHDHKKLQEAMERFEKEDSILIDHMKNLIEKYNQAILSLQAFDKKVGTKHLEEIKEILITFREPLENIGISIKEDYRMDLDEEEFIHKIESLEEPLSFLFEPMQGMVIRLYKAFRSIRIPSKNMGEQREEKYRDLIGDNMAGAVIDKKT